MRRAPAFLVLTILLAPAATAQERWPISLYRDAFRLEDRKEYQRAIDAYRKVVEKASHPQDGEMYAMLALFRTGLCQERLGGVEDALRSYEDLSGRAWTDARVAKHAAFETARDKVNRKGVDVYLAQYCAAVAQFKERPADKMPVPDELQGRRREIEERILKLDKAAIYGLRMGLDAPEPLCREFAAEMLARVADEKAIQDIADDLGRPSPWHRAGAASAVTYLLQRIRNSARLDAIAQEIEDRLALAKGRAQRATDKLRPLAAEPPEQIKTVQAAAAQGKQEAEASARKEIDANRAAAKVVRCNLPAALSSSLQDALVAGLSKVIVDANSEARLAACVAAGTLGDVRTEDSLVKVLDDADARVRAAASAATGLVRSRKAVEPLKALLVKSQPEELPDTPEGPPTGALAGRDVPSTLVRRNAAEALGRIGDVRAIPALVTALDDNDEFVRKTAHESLLLVAHKEFKAKVKVRDQEMLRNYTADMAPELRAEIIKQWQDWYGGTKAVDLLVDRFRSVAFRWIDYNPVLLFDEAYFVRRSADRLISPDESRAYVKAFLDAVHPIEEEFRLVGPEAVPQLIKAIGGEGLDDPEKRDPAVRRFVAGAVADQADKAVEQQLRDMAGDGGAPAPRRAGAAIALGLIKQPADPGADSTALQGCLNVAESADVRAAAAEALGNLGAADAVSALVSKLQDTDPAVPVAVLRAFSKMKDKASDAVGAVSDIMKKSITQEGVHEEVLEFAAQALGDIGRPEGLQPLVYGRAHFRKTVWSTAQASIQAILGADKSAVSRLIEWTTVDKQTLPYMRAAACRALGDLPADLRGPEVTDALVYRILDKQVPTEVHDSDPGVRKAAVEGLAKLKDEKGAGALVASLRDGEGTPLTMDDVRVRVTIGLAEIASDGPGKWDPSKDWSVAETQSQWAKLVRGWEEWLARKEGRALAPPPPSALEPAPAAAPPAPTPETPAAAPAPAAPPSETPATPAAPGAEPAVPKPPVIPTGPGDAPK